MIRIIARLVVLHGVLQTVFAEDCTLECPLDAPCTFGAAEYSHQNELNLATEEFGMHCQCPVGWTGVYCDHRYESCSESQDCYHGGQCIHGSLDAFGNQQLVCDCTDAVASDGTRYVGKYCETPFEKSCSYDDDLLFCVNGGDCNPNFDTDGVLCICDDGWEGYHCEFKSGQVPDCTLDCENGGVCVVGVISDAEMDLLERIWTNDEIHDHMRCICPGNFGGLLCDLEADECGDDHCYNGGVCVTTTVTTGGTSETTYHCDCTTATTSEGNRYGGQYCQLPATASCSEDNDSLFCVNGGTCKSNPLEGCDCPAGFAGTKCEYVVEEADTSGDDTQVSESCGGINCFNGASCVTESFQTEDGVTASYQYCDCTTAGGDSSTAYAGEACQYKSTEICPTTKDNGDIMFCVNGGSCQENGQCSCLTGWTGEYCEQHTKEHQTEDDPTCGDTVCYNGGVCNQVKVVLDDGTISVIFTCDCSPAFDEEHQYAGVSCEYKSTSFCTTNGVDGGSKEDLLFCTNHGTCKSNVLHGCECPDGFSGFSCEYLNIDEDTTQDTEDTMVPVVECGEYQCKNGGTCVSTVVYDDETGTSFTVETCDCSTTATDETIYAGLECENEATTFCSLPADGGSLAGSIFCVQGGDCNENVHQGCICQDGWTGFSCEYAISSEDLLEDDDAVVAVVACGDTYCVNGGTCASYQEVDSSGVQNEIFACNCSTTATETEIYGGATCTFHSTSVCQEPPNGEVLTSSDVCFNHGSCPIDGSSSCGCPTGFIGSQCESVVVDDQHADQETSCGDGYCYNGGDCVTTTIVDQYGDETTEYHCDCSMAIVDGNLYAGGSCEYKSSTVCAHSDEDTMAGAVFCVNGGQCRDDPVQGCDCPTGWNGFYCEYPADPDEVLDDEDDDVLEMCGDNICLNGGNCISTKIVNGDGESETLSSCDCTTAYDSDDIYAGPNCEFPASTLCTEPTNPDSLLGVMFCTNGGSCNTENPWSGCSCPNHWTGLHCQWAVDDDDASIEGDSLDTGIECGDVSCLNGGTCVQTILGGVVEYSCDCSTAFDALHLYDGEHCQYQSTDICSQPSKETLEGSDFCVNNGACRTGMTCHCPSGYEGDRCEQTLYLGQDSEDASFDTDDEEASDANCLLTCSNGGHCAEGAKDNGNLAGVISHVSHLNATFSDVTFEHCVCPDGFVGLTCEHVVEMCGEEEHYCLHGSKCVSNGDDYSCDCSEATATIGGNEVSSFAGDYCEHPATDICVTGTDYVAEPMYFCTNQGRCNAYVSERESDPGCSCTSEWTGPHCEIRIILLESNDTGIGTYQVVLVSGAVIAIIASLVLFIRCCMNGSGKGTNQSETCLWLRRRRRRRDADPRSSNRNIAPRRYQSNQNTRNVGDPSTSSAGLRLDPDDEPTADVFHDEPMPRYRDNPLETRYHDDSIDANKSSYEGDVI
eukprot:Nitzschia sp. Nitz4//scaffold165_size50357//21867//26251//NITZ4_007022-RA/size50357-exonerate_est2genome-gene-0.36-mRNA-1//-1//CDS//3329538135//1059//frame0